jgi:hypothetical protein
VTDIQAAEAAPTVPQIKYVAVLDSRGVYVGCDEVAPIDHKDGPNRVALASKPDLPFGRYHLVRTENKFGYRFDPVSNQAAAENDAAPPRVLAALCRQAMAQAEGRVDLHAMNVIGEYAKTWDGVVA